MDIWTVKKLTPGDHIRVNRGWYCHHGIYVGNDEVIHYCAEDGDGVHTPEEVCVRRTSLGQFCAGEFAEVYESRDKRKRRKPAEVVKYAESRLGTRGYDILNNNCEHFANECVFGEHKSEHIDSVRAQVRELLKQQEQKNGGSK